MIDESRKVITTIENLGLSFMVFYLTLISSWELDRTFFDYMSYMPNKYRLSDQLILWIDSLGIISAGNLFSIVFAISIFIVFQYTSRSTSIVLASLFAALTFKVRSAIAYPLLVVLAITGNPIVLVLLASIKEYTVVIGALYLLMFHKNKWKTICYTAISFMVWIVIVFAMGITENIGLPTGIGLTSTFLHLSSFSIMTIMIKATLTILILLPYFFKKSNLIFIILSFGVILLLGNFLEIQLWIPVIILLTMKEKKYFNLKGEKL